MTTPPQSPEVRRIVDGFQERTVRAVTDLSPRAVSLARIVDRLEAGTYTIHLQKDTDGRGLRVELARCETAQVWNL